MRSLIFVFVLTSAISGQTQTPPPIRITETVVVSARDARTISDAVESLRKSRDPLVAQMVADHIVKLTDAMAESGRVNEIGPLTTDEASVVAIREMMEKYSFPGGAIHVRPRNADSTPGSRLFHFTRSSFIAMCADMASNPLLQMRVIQENKMIVVARMVADLNEQQDKVISERAVLEGALAGFRNQDVKGVIIDRAQGIADALAVNADQNAPYELVRQSQQKDFREIGHIERGVFEVVTKPRIRAVNVAYDGKIYAATVDHFVWFFIRFLLADQDAIDPGIRARRTSLGGHLLDNLTEQLQARVIQSVLTTLDEPHTAGPAGLVLGDFSARGPGLAAIKKAPGLSQQDSARGADYKTLVVSAKQMRNLPELKHWLTNALGKEKSQK